MPVVVGGCVSVRVCTCASGGRRVCACEGVYVCQWGWEGVYICMSIKGQDQAVGTPTVSHQSKTSHLFIGVASSYKL